MLGKLGDSRSAALLLVGVVRLYQRCLRPLLPACCNFEPGCSEYMILAIEKYGPMHGLCKGVWRICRCNPWNQGGFDPP